MMIPYATTERLSERADCADSFEEARGQGKDAMDRYVRTRLYAKQRPFETLVEKDLIAYGSPDEIARVAQRYADAGLTHFLAISNFGGLPHERVLRSMELIATHVMPKCRD